MDELIKNLGPYAAAVAVMWFMLQWVIKRLDAAEVQRQEVDKLREEAHRQFIGVLMGTIATNTEALSKSAASIDRLTDELQEQRRGENKSG